MRTPGPGTGVSRALRARSVPGVSLKMSLGPFGPRAPECPESVPRVSPECQKGVSDTPGHSQDTFWTLRSPRPESPQRHPEGHSWDTSGLKGPRDPCSRPGGFARCTAQAFTTQGRARRRFLPFPRSKASGERADFGRKPLILAGDRLCGRFGYFFFSVRGRGRRTLRAQISKKFKILKFSSELEIFKRATHQTPIFCGEFWRSGLKISSEIEIFKRD